MADQQQNDDSNPLTDIELERLKMYQDTFKHMTTFCSGGILLSAAVTGALFPKPDALWVLVISIGLLALATLAAMFGLYTLHRRLDSSILDGNTENPYNPQFNWLRLSVFAAYVGLLSFAAFAVMNLA